MKFLKVLYEEIVEALYNLLNRLQVELDSRLVVLSHWSLNCKVDVFKHWENHLAEDFSPEIQIESLNSMLQDLE